jgi:hypothetical protein
VGVETCSSVWACPICANRIYARRAAEVTRFVVWALAQGLTLYMVTLTIRHQKAHSLKQLQRGMAASWRKWFTTGREATERRKAWGIKHYIRATEVTHGPNGWHPHLHIMLAADRLPYELECIEGSNAWMAAVYKLLGEEWMPDHTHGMRITRIRGNEQARYLSKLGLEIAQISTKSARKDGHQTAWGIGQDAANQLPGAGELWEEYQAAMFGQRQLTWSRGTKKLAGVEEVSDDEIAEESERPECMVIEPSAWDAMIRAGILPILVGLAKRSMPELVAWLRGAGWYGWRLLPRQTRAP